MIINNKDNIFSQKTKASNENINKNNNGYNKMRAKHRWSNYSGSRIKVNNSFINPMNNALFPYNLFYQYLSMNNPNTIKIPVPVPVPVPFPLPLKTPKENTNIPYNSSNNNENNPSFSKPIIKSSCLIQTKEKDNSIPISLNKTKMQTESNNKMNDSSQSKSQNIDNFNDSLIVNVNESEKYFSKNNENSNDSSKKEISNINIKEEKDSISDKENISSIYNLSGKSSKDNKLKNDIIISSIKFSEKNNIDFLSTMDQKRLSLDRLNYFLQNNKPVSNFNNPIKNLSPDENEASPTINKRMNLPFFYPFPMQFPFKFQNINNNNQFFQGYFNKNIIDFDKLTLNTRNTIKFQTYSSRDYYYKYVCNYTIQIENDDNFQITKRIIGKNGCFLKKIIQEACIKFGDFSTKIRLRGKGSGYTEQNGKESEEPLMLCISSLNYPTYANCCLLIDNLLKKIYNDYYDYLLKVLPKELKYSVNKKKILKYEYVVNRFAHGSPYEKNKENNNRNFKNNNTNNTDNNNGEKEEVLCSETN